MDVRLVSQNRNMVIARQRFGKHRLKAGIAFIAEQRFGNHVPAAKDNTE
jgi:hypothetical protein